MKKILPRFQKAEDTIMIVTFIIMVIASFAQVINRNFIHAGVSWFEELSRYCMIYMALLGAEAGLRDGTQLSIVAFTNVLKGILRKIVLLIAKGITVAFSGIILVTSLSLVLNQVKSGQASPGLGISMAVPYFALPFTFSIITLVQGFLFIKMIADLFKTEPTEEA